MGFSCPFGDAGHVIYLHTCIAMKRIFRRDRGAARGHTGRTPSVSLRLKGALVEGVIQGPLAPWMTPLTTHIGQAPSAVPAVSTLSDPGAVISSGALSGPGALGGPGALEGTGILRVPDVLSGIGTLSGSGALRGPGALGGSGALSGSVALSDPGRRRQS